MGESHTTIIGGDEGCVSSAKEAEVRDGDIRHMAVARSNGLLRLAQMWYTEKGPCCPRGVPGEDVAVGMAPSDGGVVGRYGDGSDGARLDSCAR